MNAPTTTVSRARGGIFFKTALLSTVVALLTSSALVVGIIFHEQELLTRQLEERASIIAASIQGVTGAFANEEYAQVTDHCMAMINSSDGVVYAVVTRKADGFSLIHQPESGWRDDILDGQWNPDSTTRSVTRLPNLLAGGETVLHSRHPFDYRGIQWGWIHTGLSLDAHTANRNSVLRIVGLIALPALALGIGSSFVFARRLTSPILKLKVFAEQVAAGNLDSQADVESADEVGALAFAMNNMTYDLKLSHARLAEAARQEADNRSREIIIKEIHHRVKNNLQVLSSLMRMKGRSVDSDELKEILRDGEARIRSMSLIHEQLYQSDTLESIDFQDYAELLTSQLSGLLGAGNSGVRCEIDAHGVTLPLDTALPCGLIVNELFSNSLKYAFPSGEAGLIKVTVKETAPREYLLDYSDDGVGLPASGKVRKGSLGMKLVRMLADQMDGDVEVESVPGEGLNIKIRIRESEYKKRV